MAAALYTPPRRRRLRFTIGGLLTWTLIICVGLARWRLPGATLPLALLASLNAWLLVGLIWTLRTAMHRRDPLDRLPGLRTLASLDAIASIGGMAVCILAIAVGLTGWRPAAATNSLDILACFGTWLFVGMLQEASHAAARYWQSREAASEARCGLILQFAVPLGIAALLAWSGFFVATQDYDLSPEWYESEASAILTYATFFLAVTCAYWLINPGNADLAEPRRLRGAVEEYALIAFGVLWAAVVLITPGLVTALVHIAIRGVESYQPTRWLGREFYPAELSSRVPALFVGGGVAAGAFLLAAVISGLAMIRGWHRRRWRYSTMALTSLCLAVVAALLAWCGARLLPEASPLLAQGVREQPLAFLPLAGALALTVGAVFAFWQTARPTSADSPFIGSRITVQCLHLHPAVMSVGLLGILTGIGSDFSQRHWGFWGFWWSSPPWNVIEDYLIEEPFKLLSVAAAIVLSRQLWNWWRGRNLWSQQDWLVDPRRFAAGWLAAAITFLLLAPVAAWCGAALVLTFAMP